MLNQEQLTVALKAFGEALPAGTKLNMLKVTPSVGYSDTEAEPVFAFVLADSDKGFQRLSQVIERGIKAYETEPGLTAALLREKPLAGQGTASAIPTPLNVDASPFVQDVMADPNALMKEQFKSGDGVINLAGMTDEQVLKMIKLASSWSAGKAFRIIPPQARS